MNDGNLRHFPPGRSGNPGGRPQGLGRYVRERLGEDGRVLVTYALNVFANPESPPRERWEALCWLADRGWGKPAQALTGPDGEALAGTDLVRLQLVLIDALAPWPAARIAVAAALAQLEPPAGEDGFGDGSEGG